MDKSEPSADELIESVIRAGAEAGYRLDRDDTRRLRITAVGDALVTPPLDIQGDRWGVAGLLRPVVRGFEWAAADRNAVADMDASDVDASR
ncbi:hypothetical protein [Nocardia nova]|uniref:hypothetical protein n=1 Tax=Nocardia nova TaxID=37330 RepID=UPI0033F02FC7